MTRLISVPFRLTLGGSAETVEQNSDQHYAELLATLIQTSPRERKMAPGFGLNDPVFGKIKKVELEACLATFGPPVKVSRIYEYKTTDTDQFVTLDFSRRKDLAFPEPAVLPTGINPLPLGVFEEILL